MAPHEEGLLVLHVVGGSLTFLRLHVLVFHVAFLEGLDGVVEHPELHFAIAAVVPEPAEAWAEKLESSAIVGVGCFRENSMGFGPFASFHMINGFLVHVSEGLCLHGSAKCTEREKDDAKGAADRVDRIHDLVWRCGIFRKERLRATAAHQPFRLNLRTI